MIFPSQTWDDSLPKAVEMHFRVDKNKPVAMEMLALNINNNYVLTQGGYLNKDVVAIFEQMTTIHDVFAAEMGTSVYIFDAADASRHAANVFGECSKMQKPSE